MNRVRGLRDDVALGYSLKHYLEQLVCQLALGDNIACLKKVDIEQSQSIGQAITRHSAYRVNKIHADS